MTLIHIRGIYQARDDVIITESKLRRLIRNELLCESPLAGLLLADMLLPDEYEGLLDQTHPATFLLNPVTAYQCMKDPVTKSESRALTDELSLIPIVGAQFNVTAANSV